MRTGALVLVFAALLLAAPAHAITTVSYVPDDEIDFATIYVAAGGDERNDVVTDMRADWTTVRARSGSPRVEAGEGCAQQAARVVRCEGYAQIVVDLGGGDDRLDLRAPDGSEFLAEVHGGAGDDSIRFGERVTATASGGPGRDLLVGGRDGDALYGGPGGDRLYGRGGADDLTGDGGRGRAGDDLLDGGAGRDRAWWSERRAAVTVDLARRSAGGRGEDDRLASIENATTGAGRDRVFGNGRANSLDGGRAADLIDGRRGDDRLGSSEDGVRDTLRCGPGNDIVSDALTISVREARPGAEALLRECERIASDAWADLEGEAIAAHPRRRGRRAVEVQVVCFGDETSCSRRATLRSRGKIVGRGELEDLSTARHPWVTVPLRRELPREATIDVVVDRVDGEGEEAAEYAVGWRFRTR